MRMDKDWDSDRAESYRGSLHRDAGARAGGTYFVTKQYCKKLAQVFGRSEKVYENRMQNISYVLSLVGRNWLMGVKPAKNIGSDIAVKIEALLEEIGGYKNLPVVAFEIAAREEANRKNPPLPGGKPGLKSRQVAVTHFQRDPRVQAWILHQARGICEGCEQPAPFHGTDGLPYLEIHYLLQLVEGGPDTVANAVALCPNCHREIHYGANSQALIAWLYDNVTRLIRK